jgi:hypothetical protein
MGDKDLWIGMQQQQQGQQQGQAVGQGEGFKSLLARAEDGMGGLDVGVVEMGMGVGGVRGGASVLPEENLASTMTRQKVAAAKQFIENHYKSHMKSLQERKERCEDPLDKLFFSSAFCVCPACVCLVVFLPDSLHRCRPDDAFGSCTRSPLLFARRIDVVMPTCLVPFFLSLW